MAQLLIADLEDDVRDKLQDLAHDHGRSVEEEVRDILRGAVTDRRPAANLGTRIARRFAGCGLDEEVPELRGYLVDPPRFDP